jgi:parallel beta-helix repeat protein
MIVVDNGGNHDYTTIQDAIDNANEGDTIFIKEGIYYEHLIIDKSVYLIGENKETTIIDGSHLGNVVLINADYVMINGLTIRNCGRKYLNSVLILNESDNSIIVNNIIHAFTEEHIFNSGVVLIASDSNIITGNTIINVTYSIVMALSSSNSINKNTFIGMNPWNSFCGGISIGLSNYNKIYHNRFSNYGMCFLMQLSKYNEISLNSFEGNDFGIFLFFSNNIRITNNNFIDNLINVINLKGNNVHINGNYWERSKFLPKLTYHGVGYVGYKPWFDIDWRPAKEPYDLQ